LEQRGWIAGDDGGERLRRYHITAQGMLVLQQAEAKYQRNQEQQERNERSSGLLGGKEIIMRLAMWMLRLYPPAWRERYEAEMVALLWQHEITLWTVLDLFIGALDARLGPHYRQARQLLPMQRLQASWKWLASAGCCSPEAGAAATDSTAPRAKLRDTGGRYATAAATMSEWPCSGRTRP